MLGCTADQYRRHSISLSPHPLSPFPSPNRVLPHALSNAPAKQETPAHDTHTVRRLVGPLAHSQHPADLGRVLPSWTCLPCTIVYFQPFCTRSSLSLSCRRTPSCPTTVRSLTPPATPSLQNAISCNAVSRTSMPEIVSVKCSSIVLPRRTSGERTVPLSSGTA